MMGKDAGTCTAAESIHCGVILESGKGDCNHVKM